MNDAMIKTYVELIRAERRTLESVPELLRADVEAALTNEES